jgi:thioredoxin 1
MTEKIISIKSLKELHNIIDTERIVMVDFTATWCGPCKVIKPEIEKLSKQYDNVKICVVDIDDNPEIASQFNVQSVPMFFFFYKGKAEAPKIRGANPKALIAKMDELYNRENK